MTFWKWSQTAASNATADASINWQEGQAPSSVNDSARAMMAAAAKYRDDTNGAIAATGTASAYVITSSQVFDSLAHLRLSEIVFLCPATNAAGVTLNVDGLGAQAINGTDGIAIPAGTLIIGGVYRVTAYTSEFILHDFYGNPYNTPLGGMMDYIMPTVPNSLFVFPIGQAISRSTYATLFAGIGTTYGVGDGSTTFNIPDLTGRVVAMKEATGTRLTTAGSGIDGGTLGSAGGSQTGTIAQAMLPNVTLGVTGSLSVTANRSDVVVGNFINAAGGSGISIGVVSMAGGSPGNVALVSTGSLSSGTTASINGGVTQTAINKVLPLIVLNKILRVI